MNRARLIGLAVLFSATFSTFALEPPDYAKWQDEMEAAATAMQAKNADALATAIRGIFEQALRFDSGDDARIAQAIARIGEAFAQYAAIQGPQSADDLMTELLAMTRQEGAIASRLSTMPVSVLAGARRSQGRMREARAIWTEFADRGAAELGETHMSALFWRREEVQAALASGELEVAQESVDRLVVGLGKSLGTSSRIYVDHLILAGEVHSTAEDYAKTMATADEAAAILRSFETRDSELLTGLGNLYWYCGRFERAREAYEAAAAAVDRSSPGGQERVAGLLSTLTGVEARLGNGAAARAEIDTASELATAVETQSPAVLFDIMIQEAYLHRFAGDSGRATAALVAAEEFGNERDLMNVESRLRITGALLNAGAYDAVVPRINRLLREVAPGSLDHFRTSELLVRVNALSTPPTAFTRIAEEVVRAYEALAPTRVDDGRMSLALAYRVEGRIEDALALERQGVERTRATLGEHVVHPLVWERHAETLRLAGDEDEARAAQARVDTERQRFAAGWLRETP